MKRGLYGVSNRKGQPHCMKFHTPRSFEMKKMILILITAILIGGLSGCSSGAVSNDAPNTQETKAAKPQQNREPQTENFERRHNELEEKSTAESNGLKTI
jgi:hypothetical protein